MSKFEIRDAASSDIGTLEALYPLAFPDEDLLPIVRALHSMPNDALSLVAVVDSRIVGQLYFSRCGVGSAKCALLGPLAVLPERQREGVGTALVTAGLDRMKEKGATAACVLGDPAYYRRFGFRPDARIEPPYRLPEEWSEAWQSKYLGDADATCAGKLEVPAPWMQESLWLP
jgi:putative acetyltransferase